MSCLALSGRRQPSLPRPDPKGRRALELRDDVIRDGVTLVFGQAFLQAANDFAGTPKRKGYGVTKHIPSGHPALTKKEAPRYAAGPWTTPSGLGGWVTEAV